MLGVLIRVGERMIELGIRQAAFVMRPREREKGGFAPGEFEQSRASRLQMAFCTLPPFRQRVQT